MSYFYFSRFEIFREICKLAVFILAAIAFVLVIAMAVQATTTLDHHPLEWTRAPLPPPPFWQKQKESLPWDLMCHNPQPPSKAGSPIPATVWLLLSGMVGLALGVKWRRMRRWIRGPRVSGIALWDERP